MALPTKTFVEDIEKLCGFLAKKPTGATAKEAKAVVDPRHLDPRKIGALKHWNLIDENGEKLKLRDLGRSFIRGTKEQREIILRGVVTATRPYMALVERAEHNHEDSITSNDAAAHWHDHFPDEVGKSEDYLNDQVLCFFNLAQGAGLGTFTLGRKGNPTRFVWDLAAITAFTSSSDSLEQEQDALECAHGQKSLNENSDDSADVDGNSQTPDAITPSSQPGVKRPGSSIFLAHGKNKAPLEQLEKILRQFNIPFKAAIYEPNLGRPISALKCVRLCKSAIALS